MTQTTINPQDHQFDGWIINFDTQMWQVGPVLTETKMSWSAESCMDHPDPARASFVVRCPRRVADVMEIGVGGNARAFVSCKGMDPYGSGAERTSMVAYQEGFVDQVTKTRLKFYREGEDRSRIPYHAVASRYRMTSATTTGMWVGTWNYNLHVSTLQDTNWSPAGKGAQRIRLTNTSGSPKTFTFEAEFQVNSGVTRFDHESGASGTATPGQYQFGVTQKGFHDPVMITYGYESWYSYGYTDLPGGLTTLVATYSLTLQHGDRVELIPSLAQTQPYAGHAETTELLIESSDALAKLGRIYVGDEPWPITVAYGRVRLHLNPAVEPSGMHLDEGPYRDLMGYEPGVGDLMSPWVRARDVDNRSALEVYRRTAMAVGRVALGLAGRVGISWALQPATKIKVIGGVATIVPNVGYTSVVETSSLEDTTLQKSTEKTANRIVAEYFVPAPSGDPEYKVTDKKEVTQATWSVNKYGSITRTIETDLWAGGGDYAMFEVPFETASPNLWSRMELARDAQSEPRFYLDESVRIVARDLDTIVGLAELIDNAARYGRLIRLVGDRPDEVSQYQRVRGGTFGFSQDGQWHLELVIEPSDFSGVEAGRFQALSEAPPTLTLGTFANSDMHIYDLRNVAL